MTSHYEGEEHHFWWSYAPEREILLLLLHVDTVWYTWDLTYEGMTQFSYEVKILALTMCSLIERSNGHYVLVTITR